MFETVLAYVLEASMLSGETATAVGTMVPGTCFNWNLRGRCSDANCRFTNFHKCLTCDSKEHGLKARAARPVPRS